jgi:uncharacterized protein YqjF (DUF2071 family)
MRWHELLFMHWPISVAALRPLIPPSLSIDTFNGDAWIGVVPFRMSGIRSRFLPPIPGTSAFPELNVRTYVTADNKPGVWFFSLDATNRLAVRVARATFNLPYYDARMHCTRMSDNRTIDYKSVRTHRGAPAAEYVGQYAPTGPVFQSTPGTLEYFLTERYCLYSADRRGRTYRVEITHASWPLQLGEAEVHRNRMVESLGLKLPDVPPLLHYADFIEAVAWKPAPIG